MKNSNWVKVYVRDKLVKVNDGRKICVKVPNKKWIKCSFKNFWFPSKLIEDQTAGYILSVNLDYNYYGVTGKDIVEIFGEMDERVLHRRARQLQKSFINHKLKILSDPMLNDELLFEVLAMDNDWNVKKAVASHFNASPKALLILGEQRNIEVKTLILQNPNCPKVVVKKILDKNPKLKKIKFENLKLKH